MSLADEREKANKLNAEGQDTLNQFKGADRLAGKASQRERATQQKATHSTKRGAAKEGRNAIGGAAMDSLNSARDFNKIRRHAQNGDVQAVAKDAAIAALKNAARQGILFLVSNPIFWGVVLVFLFLMFILYLLIGGNQTLQDMQNNSQNPLQVTVTCTPEQLSVGETAICTITVTDSQDANDISVVAAIYPFAQYVKNSANVTTCTASKPAGTYNATNNTVTWDAQKLNLPLTAPINLVFTLKVQKTINKDGVPIVVTANGAGGAAGSIGGNVAANKSTCSGKYQLTSPLGNFGDPQCNFTRQALGTEESQLDSAHKFTWDCIARYESGGGTSYDPNAYNGNSTSGEGAYGLFQMNPPGKGNNQYDNGGVNWPVQLSNAVNYNKGLGGNFGYWGTYYTNGGPCH
jgi:hypothetical protein